MASFQSGKRNWDFSKGLIPQATEGKLKVASQSNFAKVLSKSFQFMQECNPFNKLFTKEKIAHLMSVEKHSITQIFFRSAMLDLLCSKKEWEFAVQYSSQQNNDGNMDEKIGKRARNAQNISEESKEVAVNVLLGKTSREKERELQKKSSMKTPSTPKPFSRLQKHSRETSEHDSDNDFFQDDNTSFGEQEVNEKKKPLNTGLQKTNQDKSHSTSSLKSVSSCSSYTQQSSLHASKQNSNISGQKLKTKDSTHYIARGNISETNKNMHIFSNIYIYI